MNSSNVTPISCETKKIQLVLISGLSGSGKSVALRTLEDIGFFCVDNLPATMLSEAMTLYRDYGYDHIGISVDTRSGPSLGALPAEIQKLKSQDIDVRLIFLETKPAVLVKRFSETRRRHPLSSKGLTVEEAITLEQDMLEDIASLGLRIDTSDMPSNTLKSWIKSLIHADLNQLTVVFESFGFKNGVPLDADFVFDVRCLPNPHWVPELRPLTGKDRPVIEYFSDKAPVHKMINDIERFVIDWLPEFRNENRSYVTIAIGCTGGQHRSVFIAETLAKHFQNANQQVLLRHRQLAINACV